LNKTSTDILNEKVALIYEYDDRSPLFVRAANFEIEKNNLDRAVEILNKGIELYPNYSSGYMVLGKAFLLKGDYENANECFKTGSDLIRSTKSYSYYQNDLESIKKQRSPFQNLKIQDFVKAKIENTEAPVSPENEAVQEIPDISVPQIPLPNSKNQVDNSLEEIARNISAAKIKPEPAQEPPPAIIPAEDKKENKADIIPSDTLAKIYISQGEFREAIIVYKKLLLTEPTKRLYYATRIKEIEDQLDINHF